MTERNNVKKIKTDILIVGSGAAGLYCALKLPKEKQTLFFSATMPDTIISLTNSLLKNPVRISITPKSSTVDAIEQMVYFVEKKEKSLLLVSILQKSEDQSNHRH